MPKIVRRTALIGGVATALGVAGMSQATAAAPAPAPSTAARVRRAVDLLDGVVHRTQAITTIPGVAVGVIFCGKLIYAKGFGVRKVGSAAKVDAKTVFQLASVSKPISSTALSAAVSKGLFEWSDPIRKGLPGLTLADPWISDHVTLADMYSHRSGLPEHVGDILEDLGYSRSQIFSRLRLLPLGPFRLQYDYTNYGLTAAGISAAAQTGQSFEAFAQSQLFGPLGMTSTSATFADLQKRTNRAALHRKIKGVWKPNLSFNLDRQAPAGGISSDILDLAKWVTMLLAQGKYNGKTIVDKAEILEMWKPQSVRQPAAEIGGPTGFYGLGWNIDNDATGKLLIQHSGAFGTGAGTNVLLSPATDLAIIALTNGSPVGLPEAINRIFLDEVEFGKPTQDWLKLFMDAFSQMDPDQTNYNVPPKVFKPARSLSRYVGTYRNAYWGDLTVSLTHGTLLFTIGPENMVFSLTHYTGDEFFFITRGESATGESGALFGGGPGNTKTLKISAWNEGGLGTFVRA